MFACFHLCVQQDGYDPKKSKINDEKLAEFIRAAISGDLNEVPGLGPAALKLLAAGEGSNKVKDLEKNDPCYCEMTAYTYHSWVLLLLVIASICVDVQLVLKAQKYVGLQRFPSGGSSIDVLAAF